jgi:DNA-directed RNA polymerase omega subunit
MREEACTLTSHQEFLDSAIQKVGNRYLTTMLIAKRIRQLAHGAQPRVEQQEGESLFSVVVREIAEGHVALDEASPDVAEASTNGKGDDADTPAEGTSQE